MIMIKIYWSLEFGFRRVYDIVGVDIVVVGLMRMVIQYMTIMMMMI